ncbi:MAG: GHKL domain-containing protein, partial [Lachnospiraceae bacterium]|nr:GHKL domain-containing protein [Lachnospiraceae bacterium]
YLYRGKEYYCRMEKELMEINELLLRHQLRLMKAGELEVGNTGKFCGNVTVNKILSVYKTYADEENIQMEVHADLDADLAIREFDIVAILVSIFENAIYECSSAGEEMKRINMVIQQNTNKVVLLCQNTCAPTREQEGCPEHWKDKVESIQKLVRHYNGEIEFSIENRMHVSKILLDISAQGTQ